MLIEHINMRKLNDFEKHIVQSMVNIESSADSYMINLIYNVLGVYLLVWSTNYKTVSYTCKKEDNIDNIRNKLFDIVTLIKYLERINMIGIFPAQVSSGNMIYNRKKFKIESIETNSSDYCYKVWEKHEENRWGLIRTITHSEVNSIGKEIKYYANSTFHATQELRDYVKNNFKTTEEIQFKKNYQISIIALIVAILTSIASMFVR